MSVRKVSSWFLSENGQKFSFSVTTAAIMGAFCVRYVPHSLLVDSYVDFIRLYKKGFSVPVTKELNERFKKALEFADVPDNQKCLYEPFMVFGFDIVNAGTSFSKYGCKIGLPINFTYSDVDRIDKSSIKIQGESVQWALPEAKLFCESIVFSEKAQIFAIAREIKMTNNYKLLIESLYGPSAIMMSYWLARNMNKKFNNFAKPLGLRLILYGFTSLLGIGYYCFLKDMTQMFYERKADEELKMKDPIMREGGLEYYEKTLRRNIALRKLLDTDGPGVYTPLGNDVYWIRQKHVPVMNRKLFFENKEPDYSIN